MDTRFNVDRFEILVRATREFEAGRFEQALVSFEAAARLADEPLPDEALRRWGISASEAGWPLAAYVRLRQYLAASPGAACREMLEARIEIPDGLRGPAAEARAYFTADALLGLWHLDRSAAQVGAELLRRWRN